MAYPKWLTPAGNLGIVPELEYYQFALDTYDVNGGILEYSRVSGVLPEGIQIISTGALRGIPISTPTVGGDKNQEYTFSIRVKNLSTGSVSDRTFTLTVTNVAPPIITPKTVVNNNQISLVGNITANIGDYLTQSISGANAIIKTGVVNSSTVTVSYVGGSPIYILNSGNLRIISGNISLYPNVSVNSYPVSSTVVSSANTRDLGLFFDGSVLNLQLQAIEFANSAVLTWSLKSGEIPPGLTLTSDGLISGYILPIPAVGPSSDPGWGDEPWDELGWDFPLGTTSKNFSFNIEVTDGVNYDVVTYTILVYPRHYFTADSTLIHVDATVANTLKLSVDTGARHYPIILSKQTDIPVERQGGYFSFHFNALDLDQDVLQYAVPALSSGAFDEQYLIANSVPYIASTLTNGDLYTGVFPKTTIVNVYNLELFVGNSISVTAGDYISQPGSGANAKVLSSVTSSSIIPVNIITGIFTTGAGTLAVNGTNLVKAIFSSGHWSNINIVPSTVVSTPSVLVDNTSPELVAGDQIQILQLEPTIPSDYWYLGTVTSNSSIRLTGNTIISTSTVGRWLTQSISGANAKISNVSPTTGTLDLSGNLLAGTLTIAGTIISANVGDFITQVSTGANATVTSNVSMSVAIPVIFTNGTFALGSTSGNISRNGASEMAYPYAVTASAHPVTFSATSGDIITQTISGATATVLTTQPGGISAKVTFNSGAFTVGSGNVKLNGANVNMYPVATNMQTDISAVYVDSNVFKFNTIGAASFTYINGVNTYATPTKVLSVGVTVGASATQGDNGFDEGKFDQGTLTLPDGLSIDTESGWMTGTLPTQTINEIKYDFNIVVYKRDYPGYNANQQFTLTVLGDLNNRIDWLTPINLGTIENGAVSVLFVEAISSRGKTLRYAYTADGHIRLPQGLELLSNGIISGRVSFEVFSLDQGKTTIDSITTTFDNTYSFDVTASDFDQTVLATRTFTVKVLQRNIIPYENLYLKALLSRAQRTVFQEMLQDKTIFPLELIYRNEDPYYGLAKDIKTLFLPGLTPSLLSRYAAAVSTNHFNKRVNFGDIKTAIATDGGYNVVENSTGITIGVYYDPTLGGPGFIPTDFSLGYTASTTIPFGTQLDSEHIKYEVIYAEVNDENTNSLGQGPADIINLTGIINPYYDISGNSYVTAYPDSFENMSNVVVNAITYQDKGVLPDWMTSKQSDGRVLGFTRAVVLAYTQPNASSTIAYRFQQAGINLNELDFTVDRYQLDNNYTANYNITANAFIHSKETTFDRYPGLSAVYTSIGTIDYAVNLSFEEINERNISSINTLGGLDGITSFVDGEQLVFFQQEFATGTSVGDTYDLGWSIAIDPWDFESTDPWDSFAWDESHYVSGYDEHLLNPSVANQRIGIWRINIDSENMVTLTFVQSVSFYNKLYIRNGFTHGSTNIYYDPVVKSNKTIPNYSIIPQQISIHGTIFDGSGTKFLNYRDIYSVPEQGDKYIKFAKNGVFT